MAASCPTHGRPRAEIPIVVKQVPARRSGGVRLYGPERLSAVLVAWWL